MIDWKIRDGLFDKNIDVLIFRMMEKFITSSLFFFLFPTFFFLSIKCIFCKLLSDSDF